MACYVYVGWHARITVPMAKCNLLEFEVGLCGIFIGCLSDDDAVLRCGEPR